MQVPEAFRQPHGKGGSRDDAKIPQLGMNALFHLSELIPLRQEYAILVKYKTYIKTFRDYKYTCKSIYAYLNVCCMLLPFQDQILSDNV